MAKQFTVQEFFNTFCDDDACLHHLMKVRYGETLECPKCKKEGKFSRVAKRPVYQCAWCGFQISPMASTPFERSSTPLQKWFYAMYLFTTSRHGVPAKELQHQLGVTYKTAWRMGHEIRKYMAKVDGDNGLSGHVEIDEAYIGGKDKATGRPSRRNKSKKIAVLGMVERDGNVMTKVIANASGKTILPLVAQNVAKGSTISTDEFRTYRKLTSMGYTHGRVKHHIEQWVKGIHHTNSIEGFWSHLKKSIHGTHIHVSRKHLDKYLGEFEYRYNMRSNPSLMFDRLLVSF